VAVSSWRPWVVSAVPSRAIEEPESQLILELPDEQAQAGCGDEQRFRRPSEVVMLRHQQERAKLPGAEVNH
jgi:hypothetical protein